ncbi:hypothetical protein Misp01_11390 [Microtetraspora sp. NBRC 13810]|uniref:LamG-like jellyroll fold domain-containing protein n=1 Tax=Microtetraspora sp. NBRC 13810 TaxID=3030990 RepID=UPI0024A06D81|nr:LamG-like jellyroll fold domain-containing protein [Microtetraspora sp. NBRC 13810]GLW06009.1 hypothetical protein Misp01_11390 [Microtetraspora sp. NBRC 13810]
MLSFVTGVRQPAVNSQLAEAGVKGLGFDQQSGNYTTTATDLTVASAGPPLSVVRTYNSLDPRTDGIFGAGWSTRWDMKIVKETRGTSVSALVTNPDGRQVRFRSNGDGTFQPPPGMFATLAEQTGGTWRLTDKAATTYLFDAQGRLTKVTDQRNRSQDLTYAAGGKLEKVTAAGGRALHFTWTGDHVGSVASDPVNGTALTWTYTYDGNRLVQVCAPVAAPNCTSYEYGTGSQYRSSVLNSDPFGYWRLGEATGSTATDLGTGAGNATYQSVTLGQPGALTGTTDTSARFAAGSAMKLLDNTIPHLGDQLSVETWFKTGQSGVLMAAGTQQTSGIARGPMLYVGTDGKLRGSLDAVTAPITSAGVVNDNAWHHVVLTVAGAEQKLFLDGQQVGTINGQVSAWRQFATVGNGVAVSATSPAVPSGTAAFPFQGQIDEVAVYGTPLTAAEVQAHYAARAEVPHKLTKVTLPSGRVQAVNTYDERTDRLATHVDNNGGTWKIGALSAVDEWGEAEVKVTDPHNETLTYLYDAWRGYRIRGETDQLLKTTWYEYTQAGFLTKVIDRNDIPNDIYQDERGNQIGHKYCRAPGECAIEFWTYYLNEDDPFDPRNDRVTEYRDGRSDDEDDNTYLTRYEYNQYGERTKETTPATPDFPNGRSTTYTYTDGTEPAAGGGTTPAGLPKSKTAPNQAIWSYKYTAAGDLAEQVEPEGLTTTFDYDVLGRATSKTQVSDSQPDGVKTTFTYDGRGRVLTETGPGVKNEIANVTHTAQTRYTYDPDGNKLTDTRADLTGGDAERVTTYTYDDYGRLASTTDPEGGVTRQEWNHRGWITRTTDPRGAMIDQAYSKRGEPTVRTLKGWTGSPVAPQPATDVTLETRTYDNGGRLASTTDAMNRKTTYTYWMDNRLSQKIGDNVKLNGATTTRDVVLQDDVYDPAGNLTEQTTGGTSTSTHTPTRIEFDYDAAGRLISQSLDPSGLDRTVALAYDAVDNPIKVTRAGAGSSRTEVTQSIYNKTGQVTRETIENGTDDLVTTATYDDRGLLTSITDPRGNTGGAATDFTTNLRHDASGRLVEAIAPPVQVDKSGHATTAQPISRFGYNATGEETHITDSEGRTRTTSFDKAGRIVSTTVPAYAPPGGIPITPTFRSTYDDAGQLISTTDPRGYSTTYEYDALGRQVRVTDPTPQGQTPGRWVKEYDLVGEVLATVDPSGARIEATYDDLGRKITETTIERTPATAAYITKLEYNDAGFLIKSTAPGPGNRSTGYQVNPAGEITDVTDPLGHKTTSLYDLAGRLTRVTDALFNATTIDYDLAGRKVTTKDLNASGVVQRTYSYGYDAAGNQTSVTSPEGHVTRKAFNALNLPTSQVEPVSATESITISFGYDATGARTRLTDGRGNTTWTSYNTLGLIETTTEPATTAHPDLADRTWTSVYDAAGNETATIQPGGVRIDRTFDHLGRLTAQTGTGAGVATADRAFGYDLVGRATIIGDYTVEYNDRGLLTKVTKAGIQETAVNYDALGNPAQRADASGTATFTWDNANRLATATDPVAGRTLTYGYDNAHRLTSLTATGQASTQIFDYDSMNRLTAHTLRGATGAQLAKISYGWDKDDNLTSKDTIGFAGAGSNTYSYDHSGRLTSWTNPAGVTAAYEWDAAGNRTKAHNAAFVYDQRNRLTSGDGTTNTYTPRGTLSSQTKDGTTQSLTFDAFDQLIADGEATYSYDALGRMTSRTKAGAHQNFIYSGLSNYMSATTDLAGVVRSKYARDPFGELLGVQESGTVAAGALTDLHGDLVATFSAAALINSAAYDPFGQVAAKTGVQQALGYQSGYTDPDTGKVNMHSRWYQPGTGGFASRDTLTLDPSPSVQANRYTYANAAPLTGADPSGHATLNVIVGYGSNPAGFSCDYYCQNAPNTPTPETPIVTLGFNGLPGHELEYNSQILDIREWTAKQAGVMLDGTPLPKGMSDFWDRHSYERDFFVMNYRPNMSEEGASWLWGTIKTTDLATIDACLQGCGGGKIDTWQECKKIHGAKMCEAMRQTVATTQLAQAFAKNCLTEAQLRDQRNYSNCRAISTQLGIKGKVWGDMMVANFKDSALYKVLDLIVGDATRCADGYVTNCLLMAITVAGGAAVKGIRIAGKAVPKLTQVSAGLASACSTKCDWAKISGIVRGAAQGKGNFGVGVGTRAEARLAGEAWVGSGYRTVVNKEGKEVWISADNMRQYRPPSNKDKIGKVQANFESRVPGQLSKRWQNNGHLDIVD